MAFRMMVYFYFLDPMLGESKIKETRYVCKAVPSETQWLQWDGLFPKLNFLE